MQHTLTLSDLLDMKKRMLKCDQAILGYLTVFISEEANVSFMYTLTSAPIHVILAL